MFLQIVNLQPYIIINKEEAADEGFKFIILSKYTNTPFPQGFIQPASATWIETNSRYTRFQLDLNPFWFNNPEANGIFSYKLVKGEALIDEGLVKIISASPENNTYISNNDDREAIVYFEN